MGKEGIAALLRPCRLLAEGGMVAADDEDARWSRATNGESARKGERQGHRVALQTSNSWVARSATRFESNSGAAARPRSGRVGGGAAGGGSRCGGVAVTLEAGRTGREVGATGGERAMAARHARSGLRAPLVVVHPSTLATPHAARRPPPHPASRERERERGAWEGGSGVGEVNGDERWWGGVVASSGAAERAWWSTRGREGREEKEKEEKRERERGGRRQGVV
uniref:Uncharacterized protein n=1 Tax=Oryza sativa subsp. japonica TaxID=39947 RepID=Q6Z559_ORYSJ|nr:hypothetical protein [Oryza sativa Japonica Group]